MRRFLFIFLFVFSLQSFAQELKRSNVFDFTNPLGLSTPIEPSPENGGNATLSGISFVNGKSVIGFDHAIWSPSPYISTFINPYTDEVTYFLSTPSGSKVIVSTTDGATIDSIDFEGTMGGLVLDKDEPGAQLGSFGRHWADTANVHPNSVTFVSNSKTGEIQTIKVHYTESAIALVPVSSSISQGDTVPSFRSIDIVFDRDIYANAIQQITVKVDGQEQEFEVSTKNHTATISLMQEITIDHRVQVNVPASSFRDTEQPYSTIDDAELRNVTGYENVAFGYTFTVRAPRNTFNYASVNPPLGEIDSIPPVISVDFDTEKNGAPAYNVKTESLDGLILLRDNEPYCNVEATIDEEVKSQINFTLVDTDTITTSGTWTLIIPEKRIHNAFMGNDIYDRWNPEIVLEYIIKEPEPEPEPEPTDMMLLAKDLLENPLFRGIGFPTDTCQSRIILEETLDTISAPSAANDSLLSIAIGKFYNETDVNMPIAGKWYTVMGVNAAENPDSVFLSYNGEAVTLSGDIHQAVAFEVSYDNSKILLRTTDDSYLHVLTNSNKYEGTSPSNITSGAPSFYNKLTLSKLYVEGADSTLAFGKFSLGGLLGFDESMKLDSSYVAINYANTTLVDVPTHRLYFDTEKSSAIVFTETKNPTVITPEVFLEQLVLENDTFTTRLVFKNVSKATLVNADSIFVKYRENVNDQPLRLSTTSILVPEEGSDNIFVLHVNGLDGRDSNLYYELVMRVNTFDYSENPLSVIQKELRVPFQIKGYNCMYNVINWVEYNERTEAGIYYISDTDLNDFTLYSYIDHPYSALIPDTTKVITLKGYRTIRTGHLKPYPMFSQLPGNDEYQAVKLVLDTPVEAGELDYAPGEYTYTIPRGSYGDLNFGRYLEDYTSIDKSVCIVNRPMSFSVYVDNEKAAANGIKTISRKDTPTVIFDLQGRKITKTSKPGVYIINGKKHVVR